MVFLYISYDCHFRILRDPGYQSDNLGDVQEFLKEMLEMYHYEETLMNSTTLAIHSDIHSLQLQLQRLKRKGFSVFSLGCGLCNQHLAKCCGKAVVFQCSHKYHQSCLTNAGCSRQVPDGQESLMCYSCLKSQSVSKRDATEIVVVDQDLEQNEDGPPKDLVNDITNQRVVKAHAYVTKLKEVSSLQSDHKSIFDSDEFKLKLSSNPLEE